MIGIPVPEREPAHIRWPRFKLFIREGAYALIKQWSSIMWTLDELVSYRFLLAVTVAGLALLTTLVFS
jgi:hypothetical protein